MHLHNFIICYIGSMDELVQIDEQHLHQIATSTGSSSGGGGGGGNPHIHPIPFTGFGRFGYIKLGLRGGSPMWEYGGNNRLTKPNQPNQPHPQQQVPQQQQQQGQEGQEKVKKESHLSKVSILKRNPLRKPTYQLVKQQQVQNAGASTSSVIYFSISESNYYLI